MRAAVYVRVSTPKQVHQQTLEQQLERLRDHLREQGLTLEESLIFRDDGYSGSRLNRPGLDRLRDAIRERRIDQLVLTAPDRLARNDVHQVLLLEEFEQDGCQVQFLDRPMSQDPHDPLLLQIRGAVAEYERTLITERMRRGRLAKLRAGILLPWTHAPYGYCPHPDRPRDPHGLTLDPGAAAVVSEIFARYLEPGVGLLQCELRANRGSLAPIHGGLVKYVPHYLASRNMDWQTQLITLYLFVCEHFDQGLWIHVQRFAPHTDLSFTDEEVVTLYLAGILDKQRDIRAIHDHARDYWSDWFPRLPGYGAYVRRLNRLADVFPVLLERLCPEGPPAIAIGLTDSQPVVLAQQSRRFKAKVARQELANSGYCPAKKLYYHGVKIHIVGDHRPGTLPLPRYIGVTPAGMNDGPAVESVAPTLAYRELYADKAYEYLTRHANLPFTVLTPIKKEKGQARLDSADRLYSAAVSRLRQPVESLFNWIQEKTGIECASKVRSFRGLLVHVFARLAAAMFLLNARPQSA